MPRFHDLVCDKCGSVFKREVKKANQNKKRGLRAFCSPECHRSFVMNSSTVICAECKKTIQKTASQIRRTLSQKEASGNHFCGKSCSSTFRNRLRSGARHPNFKGGHCGYRRNLKDHCEDCGESRRYLLTVHHIDGNRRNSDIVNQETVCQNCHVKRHLRLSGDVWVNDFKSLTPRNALSSL